MQCSISVCGRGVCSQLTSVTKGQWAGLRCESWLRSILTDVSHCDSVPLSSPDEHIMMDRTLCSSGDVSVWFIVIASS